MTEEPPAFNPLDRRNLALAVARALLEQPLRRLPLADRFVGAGLYALYYSGKFEPYAPISDAAGTVPIYVGRAMPPGSRTGTTDPGARAGPALLNRIKNHEASIDAAVNLALSDFSVRYLVVDDAFIALGEAALIERFRPLWNQHVSGFGGKTPGARRFGGDRSEWDELHPGRPWYSSMRSVRSPEDVVRKVSTAFKSRRAATIATDLPGAEGAVTAPPKRL